MRVVGRQDFQLGGQLAPIAGSSRR
jgi:hypothetical protein